MKTAVACYMKDEASIVGEFLGHYHTLGFDRAYVFDNGSTDGTRDLLNAAQDAARGWLAWVPWPDSIDPANNRRQIMAYDRAVQWSIKDGIDWLLLVDTDEFLMSVVGYRNVRELLSHFHHRQAIGIHWCFFGSSGHVLEPEGLVTENFLLRGPPTFGPCQLVKSFVRPGFVQGFWSPHVASIERPRFDYVNVLDQVITWEGNAAGYMHQPAVIAPWRIQHYWTRSKEAFARKLARSRKANGFSHRSDDDFKVYDLNDHFDVTGLMYSESIRRGMRFLGLPEPPRPGLPEPKPVEIEKLPPLGQRAA